MELWNFRGKQNNITDALRFIQYFLHPLIIRFVDTKNMKSKGSPTADNAFFIVDVERDLIVGGHFLRKSLAASALADTVGNALDEALVLTVIGCKHRFTDCSLDFLLVIADHTAISFKYSLDHILVAKNNIKVIYLVIAIDKKPAMPVSVCKDNTARGIGKHFGKKISRKISFWKTFWTQSKFISLIINVIKIFLENFLQI